MEENTNPQVSQPQLSESLTRPTGLSKILAMILFIALPFAGFYLGMKYQEKIAVNKEDPIIESSPIACTMEAKQCPDGSYVSRIGSNCEFSPCPANDETADWKTYKSDKIMDAFHSFIVSYPPLWELTINEDSNYKSPKELGMLFLKLKKDGATLEIVQAPMGGESCIYPQDLDIEGPQSRFGDFTQIYLSDGTVWRRSRSLTDPCEGACYSVCHKPGAVFQKPTSIGAITYIFPEENEALAKELDQILSTFKFID